MKRWLVLCALASATFAWLGAWQVQRLHWKTALIAHVSSRASQEPEALPPPEQWSRMGRDADEYRNVRFTGRWDAPTVWVHAGSSAGWGYWLMRALRIDTGATPPSWVWVNVGFVPEAQRQHVQESLSRTEPHSNAGTSGVGLLRWSEPAPPFRHNDPAAGLWYGRDIKAMTAAQGLDATRTSVFFIDAKSISPAISETQPGLTIIHFNNNHAAYALTWFALALLCIVAAYVGVRNPRDHADNSVS